jgi:dTDP-4-amino-4,6-dideoxygalactose transaminase
MELAVLGGSPVRRKPFPLWPAFGQAEQDSLLEVLQSNSWGGYNKKVEEFESSFSAAQKVRHTVSCANGTVALQAALQAIDIGCGDEVIVPPFTFIATATAVLLCHGSPVFADIDPDSLGLSPAAVEAAITPRTKAIIAVHFGGHPADMDSLVSIAKRHGIALIEDSAHAHGATWRGTPVGNFGVCATFSFQGFKLVTSGEGGAVVTNSEEMAARVWSYCNQGRRKGSGWYEHFTLGTNLRLTGFQAAVLCEQLKKLPQQTRTREANVDYFRSRLASAGGFTMAAPDERVGNHPHYLVTLRFDPEQFDGLRRETVIDALRAEGIPFQPVYPYPLYRNPVFSSRQLPPCRCTNWRAPQHYESLQLPETERICQEGVWLEHNLFLGTKKDVDDILKAIEKVRSQRSSLLTAEVAATSASKSEGGA